MLTGGELGARISQEDPALAVPKDHIAGFTEDVIDSWSCALTRISPFACTSFTVIGNNITSKISHKLMAKGLILSANPIIFIASPVREE